MNTTNDIKSEIVKYKLLIKCARLRNEISLLPDMNVEECKEKEEVFITDECSQFLVSGDLAQVSSPSDFEAPLETPQIKRTKKGNLQYEKAGQKKYFCQKCPYSTSVSQALGGHVQKVHRLVTKNISKS